MRIVLLSRSDSTGGAAVVSRRLTEALRRQGHDASLLVVEKKTDLPYVVKADYPLLKPAAFYAERAQIFLNNGFSRKNLFKVDTASFGLPLWKHPLVKEADAVILNWTNQGMLSLDGVRKICSLGKSVTWTMHDMWELTGICHHSMTCRRYLEDCGNCPLLDRGQGIRDLSWRTYCRKRELYGAADITFVAVSRWLEERAREASLMRGQRVVTINNPYDCQGESAKAGAKGRRRRILFSAATIDNWIKGLDTLREALGILGDRYPKLAVESEVAFLGNVKNPASLEGFALPVVPLGYTTDEKELIEHYRNADVIVNSSYFESFGLILTEGQAYGSVPVAFDRGGQSDIIDHQHTGYLADWSDNPRARAENLATGIAWALENRDSEMIKRMRRSVEEKFSYENIARQYINLFS